jgi:putative ATP-dependent endonuclease of OLD family
MKIRRVIIQNFRGIQALDWRFDSRLIALIGAGDSTKTSILDAIGLALTTRYAPSFTDADFYGCNTSNPIKIRVVISELPKVLVEERNQGKHLSGVNTNGDLFHDPINDTEQCLIVTLTIDESLEPLWSVVRPSQEQPDGSVVFDDDDDARVPVSHRQHLGFFRVGDYIDTHLRWSKGSALSILTASKTTVTNAVVDAQRHARQAVELLSDTPLHTAADVTMAAVRKLGGSPFTCLRPGLDPTSGASTATLVLHDGAIPLTSFGVGSRRLTSLAIQENALPGGAIVAIDELENGLDPHRLIHLVRYLHRRAADEALQVFFTTHSPTVVELLTTDDIHIVRSESGTTSVARVPSELTEKDLDITQGLIRAKPSALLGRRVIVGEGATETGMLRRLLCIWDQLTHEQVTSVTSGVVVTNGGGDSHAPKRARCFQTLGYPTMLVIDGDSPDNSPEAQAAAGAAVDVVQWSSGCALEDVITRALDASGLQAFVDAAVEEIAEPSVRDGLANWLPTVPDSLDVAEMIQAHGLTAVRTAIASAAKGKYLSGIKKDSKAWFKREDRGERLADVVWAHRQSLAGSELAQGLTRVQTFVYAPIDTASEASNPNVSSR